MKKEKFICPLCGCDYLMFNPAEQKETCPCCKYKFGSFTYNKNDLKKFFQNQEETEGLYLLVRDIWLGTNKELKDDNLIKQLNNIEGFIFRKNIKYGGFGEFQYCEKDLPIKELLDYKNIENWKDESLFVEYATNTSELFWNYYLPLLKDAFIDEDKHGFDDYGDNYYTPEQTFFIYKQIKENKNLPDRALFLNWLEIAVQRNKGFYFLGA